MFIFLLLEKKVLNSNLYC